MNDTILDSQFDTWVKDIEKLNNNLEDLGHFLDNVIKETDLLNKYYTYLNDKTKNQDIK